MVLQRKSLVDNLITHHGRAAFSFLLQRAGTRERRRSESRQSRSDISRRVGVVCALMPSVDAKKQGSAAADGKGGSDDLLDLPPAPPGLRKVPSIERSQSRELSARQVREYREAWKLFDTDGDGFISPDELRELLTSTGQVYSEQEVKRLIEEADEDGDGQIDFDEFLAVVTRPTPLKEEISNAFSIFDKENRGFFGTEEIKALMAEIGESVSDEEALAMFREADVNSDGKITLDDLIHLANLSS